MQTLSCHPQTVSVEGHKGWNAYRDAGLRRLFLALLGLIPRGGLDLPLGLVKLSLRLPIDDLALL